MISKENVIDNLKTVLDPELGIDVWTMGLIYDINIVDEKSIKLLITYTFPGCPLGNEIQESIRSSISQMGFEQVDIEVTFDPPWRPPHELRAALNS